MDREKRIKLVADNQEIQETLEILTEDLDELRNFEISRQANRRSIGANSGSVKRSLRKTFTKNGRATRRKIEE
ncbi:MAG TPA: hypothetical protein VNZ45_01545 [Bacteroidia bacterium]|nr:hypothetical protein [Bacteroidia bacterium]